ncbi:hypothetical protein CTI10_001205 [Delftia acidovorans]|uniref:Uncharacterized protein n=1 Tax=Chryseobacterium sp. B5 TaxID=2050562 RepID=A0A2G7TA46_9FLAO|nr:hypothetical protein CTI10_001205 [Delftia acidovorans]
MMKPARTIKPHDLTFCLHLYLAIRYIPQPNFHIFQCQPINASFSCLITNVNMNFKIHIWRQVFQGTMNTSITAKKLFQHPHYSIFPRTSAKSYIIILRLQRL